MQSTPKTKGKNRSLDELWADVTWKQHVDIILMELKAKVEKIEDELFKSKCDKATIYTEYDERTLSPASRRDTSFATSTDDGVGGLWTCLRMVKYTRLATVQCLWLLFCIIFYSYFIYFHCERAKSSYVAEFKPQKKSRVINFATDFEPYQMPNFSLIVSSPGDKSGFDTNLRQMVDSSDFVCRYYFDFDSSNEFGLAKPISINVTEEYSHLTLWMVNIVPEEPPIRSRLWYCSWRFKTKNFTEALLFVGRKSGDNVWGSFKSMHLSFYNDETAIVSFDYAENVIETLEDGTIYEFVTSINEVYLPSDPTTDFNVEVHITMHPEVSYWQEYIDYTPEDALSSLGGLLTLLSVAYFWVAYYIAVHLGRRSWEMGILPEMSFVFSNLEKILLIKECLDKNKIIPQHSTWFGRAATLDRETELTTSTEKTGNRELSARVL